MDAMAAHLGGVLEFTDDGCPYTGGIVIAFPEGARGVVTPTGARAVMDSDGQLYGVDGQRISFGGGSGRSGVVNRCLAPLSSDEIFQVNQTAEGKFINR